jgi:hypothetical protein
MSTLRQLKTLHNNWNVQKELQFFTYLLIYFCYPFTVIPQNQQIQMLTIKPTVKKSLIQNNIIMMIQDLLRNPSNLSPPSHSSYTHQLMTNEHDFNGFLVVLTGHVLYPHAEDTGS